MPNPTVFVGSECAAAPQEEQSILASRRGFLTLTAAACGSALLLGSLPAAAMGYNDQRRLRLLEEIERLEKEFFLRAAHSGTADGLSERESNTLNLIARQDSDHTMWLLMAAQKFGVGSSTRTEGGVKESSRPAVEYRFPSATFATRGSFFAAALFLKETAVGAYHGAVGELSDPKMVEAVASLAGVEGRHLAMLRELSGQDPFVDFEPIFSTAEIGRRLRRYNFNMEGF